MIIVKFYGLVSVYSGHRQIEVEAGTVREALERVAELGVEKSLLRGALIFVGSKQLKGITRMRHRLSPGDELSLLSPAGGG